MEALDASFQAACQAVKQVEVDPMVALKLYGLYKQATAGTAPDTAPDGLIARQKHSAWKECASLSQSEAKAAYVELAVSVRERSMGNTVSRFTIESTALNPSAESGTDVDSLCTKIRSGELDSALLLQLSVNVQDAEGLTPLHHAADSGQAHLVRELIQQCNADVNRQDLGGMTPLHYAVVLDNQEVVAELLLSPSIDLSIRDQDGQMAMDLASEELRELLIGRSAA